MAKKLSKSSSLSGGLVEICLLLIFFSNYISLMINNVLCKYPNIYPYQSANKIQHDSFNDIFHSNKSVIIRAPTGSGKTMIFEIAVLKCLLDNQAIINDVTIIYVAPLKSLCHERFNSWQEKFKDFNISGIELTGDYETPLDVSTGHIIYMTPEKLDFVTRKQDSFGLRFDKVKLLCFDEIHTINNEGRGVTLEVVITRLKYLVSKDARFLALSATIGNIDDFVNWLSTENNRCVAHEMADTNRPVKLSTFVLAYPRPKGQSLFQFDNLLNHRIPGLIGQFAAGKPVLIFCMTRKSAMQVAKFLVDQTIFEMDSHKLEQLAIISQKISEEKLRACIIRGVGYHHAGVSITDRQIVENAYLCGVLPVLASTSTLAMGVNLPAHLVIIKGTSNYNFGSEQSYTQNTLLQMIGRAGRPQFDTSATALIMTDSDQEMEMKRVLQLSSEVIESHLPVHLIEHLNAEISLGHLSTIADIEAWIQTTFFYIRYFKNPGYYGVDESLLVEMLPQTITEMIMKNINLLYAANLVRCSDDRIESTACGQLMAKYFLDMKTMQQIQMLTNSESLENLIDLICHSSELGEISLRYNERSIINNFNKHRGPSKLRFPIKGRITNVNMKIKCLIQAVLGSQEIKDSALLQDTEKIFRVGNRIIRCCHDYFFQLHSDPNNYTTLLNCTLLKKCLVAKLWDNAWLICQQFPGIGPSQAAPLTDAGLNTLNKIANANPQLVESILHRHPPFGKKTVEYACGFPRFELTIEQIGEIYSNKSSMEISVKRMAQKSFKSTKDCDSRFNNDCMIILIGDHSNNVLLKARIMGHQVSNGAVWQTTISITKAENPYLNVDLLSESFVGFDIRTRFKPTYATEDSDVDSEPEIKVDSAKNDKISKIDSSKIIPEIKQQKSATSNENDWKFTTPIAKKPKVFSWKTCVANKKNHQNSFLSQQCHSSNIDCYKSSVSASPSFDSSIYDESQKEDYRNEIGCIKNFTVDLDKSSSPHKSEISDQISNDSFDKEIDLDQLDSFVVVESLHVPTDVDMESCQMYQQMKECNYLAATPKQTASLPFPDYKRLNCTDFTQSGSDKKSLATVQISTERPREMETEFKFDVNYSYQDNWDDLFDFIKQRSLIQQSRNGTRHGNED